MDTIHRRLTSASAARNRLKRGERVDASLPVNESCVLAETILAGDLEIVYPLEGEVDLEKAIGGTYAPKLIGGA